LFFPRFYPAALLCLALAGCGKGDDCFNRVKSDLKDPESARVIDVDDVGDIVKITIRAANGFGAYSHVYGFCKVNSHKVSSESSGWADSTGWTYDAK
jgi:hypothetical protein